MNLIKALRRQAAAFVPVLSRIIKERDDAREELRLLRQQIGYAPGHYYSPIPSDQEITHQYQTVKQQSPFEVMGLELNFEEQERWLECIELAYPDLPFEEVRGGDCRYYYDNQAFIYSDAIALFGMMRTLKPRRIVEIGSGYSSAVMLDTNERFLNSSVALTFIEPYPDRLRGLLRKDDLRNTTIIEERLQDVRGNPWASLKENDILFIDSSHVSKCGSDVNQLFFEVLPSLAPGVVVHVHDVFPKFEYPEEWLRRGWYWNEDYLLRAFLAFNSEFEVLFWPSVMFAKHQQRISERMPLCLKNTGSSFYMRRRL